MPFHVAMADLQDEDNLLQVDEDQNPEDRKKPTMCSSSHGSLRKITLIVFIIIMSLVLVARTGVVIAMPILKQSAKHQCSMNSTSVDIQVVSVVRSSSMEYLQRLSDVMMVIITILQWPEHGYLFCYLYRFFVKEYSKWRQFFCETWYKGCLVMLFLSVLTLTKSILERVCNTPSSTTNISFWI